MVVLLPCQCLNVTVHLASQPQNIDAYAPGSDPCWAALLSDTSWPIALKAYLSIGGIAVQHKTAMVTRRTGTWQIHSCVNCMNDVYAQLLSDPSVIAINPSLQQFGRSSDASVMAAAATQPLIAPRVPAGMHYSQTFHVMVDSNPPPLGDGQTPDGDPETMEMFSELQQMVMAYYEEEQKQMTARISAYVEQEEVQLNKLRQQAFRDRNALWHRIRLAHLQQRRGALTGSSSPSSSSPTANARPASPPKDQQMTMQQTAPSPNASTSPGTGTAMSTDGSPTAEIKQQQQPQDPAATYHSPVGMQQVSTNSSPGLPPSPMVPATPVHCSVISPLAAIEDEHSLFKFDEEQQQQRQQQQQAAMQEAADADLAAAAATQQALQQQTMTPPSQSPRTPAEGVSPETGPTGPLRHPGLKITFAERAVVIPSPSDSEEDAYHVSTSVSSVDAQEGISDTGVSSSSSSTTGVPGGVLPVRPRRAAPLPPMEEDVYIGFSMHDMPSRPRIYSASLPMSVPIPRQMTTAPHHQQQRQQRQSSKLNIQATEQPGVLMRQRRDTHTQQLAAQQQQQLQQQQQQSRMMATSLAAPLPPPLPRDPDVVRSSTSNGEELARSFAVPVSSNRKMRAWYI